MLKIVEGELQPTIARLENWALWSRSSSDRSGGCQSAERYYRSPQVWDARNPAIQPDHRDAMEVHRVVWQMPHVNGLAIKLHFVNQANPRSTCRKLVLRYRDYDEFIRRSIIMVRNGLLAIQKKEAYKSTNNLTYPSQPAGAPSPKAVVFRPKQSQVEQDTRKPAIAR